MFAASNGDVSVCFESRLRIWGQGKHDVVRIPAETLSPDAVSHNVVSVMLQIRASDLTAEHQRLLTDQAHAKKTGVQQADRLAHIHTLVSCVHSERLLYLPVCKHANTITFHIALLSFCSSHLRKRCVSITVSTVCAHLSQHLTHTIYIQRRHIRWIMQVFSQFAPIVEGHTCSC